MVCTDVTVGATKLWGLHSWVCGPVCDGRMTRGWKIQVGWLSRICMYFAARREILWWRAHCAQCLWTRDMAINSKAKSIHHPSAIDQNENVSFSLDSKNVRDSHYRLLIYQLSYCTFTKPYHLESHCTWFYPCKQHAKPLHQAAWLVYQTQMSHYTRSHSWWKAFSGSIWIEDRICFPWDLPHRSPHCWSNNTCFAPCISQVILTCTFYSHTGGITTLYRWHIHRSAYSKSHLNPDLASQDAHRFEQKFVHLRFELSLCSTQTWKY